METKGTPLRIRRLADVPSKEGVYHLRDALKGLRIGLVHDRAHAEQILCAVNSHAQLIEALERIANDTILDRQDIEYYKQLHLIHKDWAKAALAAVEPNRAA